MAPTTRSSTPASPTDSATRTSPRNSARRLNRCTKCGRPRAGHPRSGCPYADDRQTAELDAELDQATDTEPEPELSQALGSLQIYPTVDDKAALRARRTSVSRASNVEASLASLSTTSREVLNLISQPGMMRDNSIDDHAPRANMRMRQVVHWQETLQVISDGPSPSSLAQTATDPVIHASSRSRSVMPGTLLTPDSSIFGTPGGSPPPELSSSVAASSISTPSSLLSTPRPLARTLSVEERAAFLDGLIDSTRAPPASVFSLPMNEIYQIQHAAAKVGFYSRVVPSKAEGGEGWLILGSDDRAVHLLFEGISQRQQENQRRTGGRGLTVAAGGAVVGAVATFTGLAFS
jgi:hypothetical protein